MGTDLASGLSPFFQPSVHFVRSIWSPSPPVWRRVARRATPEPFALAPNVIIGLGGYRLVNSVIGPAGRLALKPAMPGLPIAEFTTSRVVDGDKLLVSHSVNKEDMECRNVRISDL